MKWQIPYAGAVHVFDDGRITASEARLQKRLTDGMTPTEAENKRWGLDPDAWIAALAIARRRAGATADEAVVIDPDQLELTEIMDRTRAAELAARAAAKPVDTEQPATDARLDEQDPEPVSA